MRRVVFIAHTLHRFAKRNAALKVTLRFRIDLGIQRYNPHARPKRFLHFFRPFSCLNMFPGPKHFQLLMKIADFLFLDASLHSAFRMISWTETNSLTPSSCAWTPTSILKGVKPDDCQNARTSDRETVDFHVSGSVTGSSVWPIGDARKVRVDSEPIDQVIADHDPSVLVVDAEGAERDLLLPSANLKNIRAIIVEFHPQIIGEDGVAEIKNALATKGFVPHLSRGGNVAFERTAAPT